MLHRWGTLPEKSLKPCLTKAWFRQPTDPKQTNHAHAGILSSHSQHCIVLSMWNTLSFLFPNPSRSRNLQIKHQGKDWSEPVQLREGKLSLRGEKTVPTWRKHQHWFDHIKLKWKSAAPTYFSGNNSHRFLLNSQALFCSGVAAQQLFQHPLWREAFGNLVFSSQFMEMSIISLNNICVCWRRPLRSSARNEADTTTKSIRYGLV